MKKGVADRYFFVRFNDPAPHVRLRLGGPAQDWRNVFRPLLQLKSCTTVKTVSLGSYTPELDRYGGPGAIAIAEAIFFASSRVANALLLNIEGAQDLRRGRATIAITVLLHAVYGNPPDAKRLLKKYSTGFLASMTPSEDGRLRLLQAFQAGFERQSSMLGEYVAEVWRRAVHGEHLGPELYAFHCQVTNARRRLEAAVAQGQFTVHGEATTSLVRALAYLVPSYLHMMNNRLGVSILDEAYLANVISRALDTGTIAALCADVG